MFTRHSYGCLLRLLRLLRLLPLLPVLGCESAPVPRAEGLVPNVVQRGSETPAEIRGEDFFNYISSVSLGNGPTVVSRTWMASIDDDPAFEILRQDESTLRLTIPSTLALGEHVLTVVAPSGDRLVVSDRLRVVDMRMGDSGADVAMLDGSALDGSMLDGSALDAAINDGGPDTSDAGGDAGVDAGTSTSCGDRVLDMGEACDDGNVADGDGCGADCQLEVTRDACPGTPIVIGLGVQIYTGTLSPSASTVECRDGIGGGPDRVYEIDPNFNGSLNIRLIPTSSFDAALMTRSACPGRSEYYCADAAGDSGVEMVDGGVRASNRYMVIASGAGRSEAGDYMIRFEGRR